MQTKINSRKKLYLVRHGQTEFNVLGKAAGQIDCPITEKGKKQAQTLRDGLALVSQEVNFDVVIHSGLLRAEQTCHILNSELNLPVVVMSIFQEIHYGKWQGKLFNEVKKIRHNHPLSPPNGEPYRLFEQRVSAGLIMASDTYQQPLIVCHGGVIESIFGRHGSIIPTVENSILYSLEGDFVSNDVDSYSFKKINSVNGVVTSEPINFTKSNETIFY